MDGNKILKTNPPPQPHPLINLQNNSKSVSNPRAMQVVAYQCINIIVCKRIFFPSFFFFYVSTILHLTTFGNIRCNDELLCEGVTDFLRSSDIFSGFFLCCLSATLKTSISISNYCHIIHYEMTCDMLTDHVFEIYF